jgi:hypothetical protein
MPRIRMLKPDHRSHRKVGPLSDRTYRLWISMIMESDDEGRFVCDSRQLRVLTWPYHAGISTAKVESSVLELASAGLISVYTIGEVRYGFFPSWRDHQRPKYPSLSKLPSPFPQSSPNAPGSVGEGSPTNRIELGLNRIELNRTESGRDGKEGKPEGLLTQGSIEERRQASLEALRRMRS